MGDDLLSIAFTTCNSHSPSSSSLVWNDFHSLGVFDPHWSPYMDYDYGSPLPSDHGQQDTCLQSTGYLEDVLSEFGCKRRRLLMFSDHHQKCWAPLSNDLIEECCQYSTKCDDRSINTGEEGMSETTQEDSSSSSQKDQFPDSHNTPQKANGMNKATKKRVLAKVAYPFAMVKPGGCEGDVTLNDINERILMPPTRPVRHPVGDYACRPMISPDGPGLSGKAVVAFTRIHTQGRGTITIIRTRG